jgi:putative ABC transport system permease protein
VITAVLVKAWADVRRQRTHTVVIVAMTLLACGTIALGLNLLQRSTDPFDRAFDAQRGAHLQVRYLSDDLADTPATLGANAAEGPWPSVGATVQYGGSRYDLGLVGRSSPGGRVDVLRMVAGHWVQGPGEVVLNYSFTELNRIRLGDRLAAASLTAKVTLTVVGIAVDVDQGPADLNQQQAWVTPVQISTLGNDKNLEYQMVYRFPRPPSQEQLTADLDRLRSSLPVGTVTESVTYRMVRSAFTQTTLVLVSVLIAVGIFALAVSLATVANLVVGAVLTSYREIGVTKALGFTPGQIVATLVTSMLIPAAIGCAVGAPVGALLSLPLVAAAASSVGLPSPAGIAPAADLAAPAAVLLAVLLAAAIPALRAGRLSAVAAISAGAAPQTTRSSRLSHQLHRLRLPRPVSLGAGDAVARPLRSTLTVVAVMAGVATIVFAIGLRGSVTWIIQNADRLSGDVSIQRDDALPDSRVMAIAGAQAGTAKVLGYQQNKLVVPGIAAPILGTALRGDAAGFGWSTFLVQGRWYDNRTPGEVLLARATILEAHLTIGSYFDASIDGHPITLHLVGEVFGTSNNGHTAWYDWTTLASVGLQAEPLRYSVQLHPGTDAAAYAQAFQAQEPNSLQVNVPRATSVAAIDAVNAILLVLAIVLGLVAAGGVLSTTLLNVRQRRRDIAIMKTVGMAPVQILAMVLTSAAVFGIAGGLLGTPIGQLAHHRLLAALLNSGGEDLPTRAYNVLPTAALYLLGLSGVAIALLGALLPARHALRNRIAPALRSE